MVKKIMVLKYCAHFNNYSFRKGHGIRFCDVSNMKKTLFNLSMVTPEVICSTPTPSTLLCTVTDGWSPCEVHWLDLSGEKPKAAAGKQVINTDVENVVDMCFVQDGYKQLVILANSEKGLFAYNAKTNKQEWKWDGKFSGMKKNIDIRGITTDGRGHLFVSDRNNQCIYVLSPLDGACICCLLNDDDIDLLGNPGIIRWCEKTSSLAVACEIGETWYFKVIDVEF